jgi:hypothetical protein
MGNRPVRSGFKVGTGTEFFNFHLHRTSAKGERRTGIINKILPVDRRIPVSHEGKHDTDRNIPVYLGPPSGFTPVYCPC